MKVIQRPSASVSIAPVELQESLGASSSPPDAPGAPEAPSLIEQAVRAWAQETKESAPPRWHLDYAQHVEDCLPQLLEALEGLK